MEENVTLFKNNSEEVILPSNNITDTDSVSDANIDISKAIYSDKGVKKVIIPEENSLSLPNYVLDFSDYNEINLFQKESLIDITSKSGDITLYLYNKKSLVKFGVTDNANIGNVLILMKQHIFEDAIHIFKDVVPGKELNELYTRTVSSIRLDL